jgi:integrase
LQFELAGRRCEICALEWDWIDFENRRAVWPDSKTDVRISASTRMIGV